MLRTKRWKKKNKIVRIPHRTNRALACTSLEQGVEQVKAGGNAYAVGKSGSLCVVKRAWHLEIRDCEFLVDGKVAEAAQYSSLTSVEIWLRQRWSRLGKIGR